MKKIFISILVIFSLMDIFALDWSISNIIGGDKDKFRGDDLISVDTIDLNDKLKVDLTDDYFYGKLGFEIYDYEINNSVSPCFILDLLLAARLPYVEVFYGSSTFSRYTLKSCELFALDDTPSFGKVLRGGIGFYSSIPFRDSPYTLKFGAEIPDLLTKLSFDDSSTFADVMNVSAGLEFLCKNKFSIGFTGHNLLNGIKSKYTLSGQFRFNDFKVNGGFIYNLTDTDVTALCTRYALFSSILYNNKKLGLKAGFDITTGLNDEYLDGKKVQKYGNSLPFYTGAFIKYNFMENLSGNINVTFKTQLGNAYYNCFSLTPKVTYSFLNDIMEVSGGLRITCDSLYGTGKPTFSIPLTFKVKYDSADKK